MSIQPDNRKICTRCIYDSHTAGISFDEQGVCNYCHMTDSLIQQYHTGKPEGEAEINRIVQEIKRAGAKKPYDCIVGISGGTDSCYLLWWAKDKGLRPLAVHYDNTWNTAIATENIRKMLSALNVDLYTHVIDNKEADDIFRSFFKAGVPEIDAATDLALAETMYRAASRYGIKYVLEGHSFIAEGITPLAKNYFDGKYIKTIHERFGKRTMKSYPLMTFAAFMKWTLFQRIRKIRPLWYIDYSKEAAREFLKHHFDWKNYGGHHLENRITAFAHSVYYPEKFNVDYRNNTIAASVRSGLISRDQGIHEYYHTEPYIEPDLVNYVIKRLNITHEEYEQQMHALPHFWQEFPTYKRRFELLRPLFYILAKSNLVPQSFYMKYCFRIKSH